MMGDLNEWSRQAGCLRDFCREFESAATGPSFHARHPIARLDRILVSPDLRIADCGVHQSAAARKASDHFAGVGRPGNRVMPSPTPVAFASPPR